MARVVWRAVNLGAFVAWRGVAWRAINLGAWRRSSGAQGICM